MMRAIAVYCGSSMGSDPAHAAMAQHLGQLLGQQGITLVYGGGNVGLMGVLANAVVAAGGRVVGVITEGLQQRELGHEGLAELHVVDTMHTRKAMMADRADAFIALPGGFGTLDELFEMLTWAQLGIHGKPIGLLDVNDYYAPLLEFLDAAVRSGFLRSAHRQLLVRDTDPQRLLDRLRGTPEGQTDATWRGRDPR